MSTPVDIGTVVSNLLNAVVSAFQDLINIVSENLGTIVSLALVGGIIGATVYIVRRFGGSLAGMFRGLFRF